MMLHAYSSLYLDKSSRTLGNMLHDAVIEFGMDGTDFLNRFIQSDIAEQFENGNPKYIAGKSGAELFLEVIEKTTGDSYIEKMKPIEAYDRSDVYWVGWMLAHYQWYSGRTYKSILDAHFFNTESKLKTIRKRCGLTQEALAKVADVSVNTIRAYERKSKDLNKAQFDIIMRLTSALKCDISDLLD